MGQVEVPESKIAVLRSMLEFVKQSSHVRAKFLASILGKIMPIWHSPSAVRVAYSDAIVKQAMVAMWWSMGHVCHMDAGQPKRLHSAQHGGSCLQCIWCFYLWHPSW